MATYSHNDLSPEDKARRAAKRDHARATYLRPVRPQAVRRRMLAEARTSIWPDASSGLLIDGQGAQYSVCAFSRTTGPLNPID